LTRQQNSLDPADPAPELQATGPGSTTAKFQVVIIRRVSLGTVITFT